MRIVCLSDSFKGSLDSSRIGLLEILKAQKKRGIVSVLEMIHEDGVNAIVPVPREAVSLETALEKAEEYYLVAAEETFRILKAGMEMGAAQRLQ